MIIKSMSRKQGSFAQLVHYIEEGAEDADFEFTRNMFTGTAEQYIGQFEENASYLPRRKNGVYLYHEVVSITRSGSVSNARRKEILREIVERYIEGRCPDSLVYARIHDEKDEHMHCHLCISSNALESTSKLRLSKAEFARVKQDTEKWALLTYPELGQEVAIGKQRTATITEKGVQLKKRTGKLTQKEAFADRIREFLLETESKREFFTAMEARGLELYQRGKHTGFLEVASGRKHRLATLGLEDEFRALSVRLDLEGRRGVIDYQRAAGSADRVEGLAGRSADDTEPEKSTGSVRTSPRVTPDGPPRSHSSSPAPSAPEASSYEASSHGEAESSKLDPSGPESSSSPSDHEPDSGRSGDDAVERAEAAERRRERFRKASGQGKGREGPDGPEKG